MRRLIVVGLDGADSKIIASLIEEGQLKNFKEIIEGGCWGELKSTVPPITIPAWPAMFSGKNPSRLNAVDFFRLEPNYNLTFLTSSYWKRHMLWAILGEEGISCVLINVPGTNPAYPINGYMISSTFGELETYPDNLETELDMKPLKDAVKRFKKAVTDSQILKASEEEFRESANLTFKLMEQKKWQLFVWVIRLADIAMHRGDSQNIRRAYILIDEYLAFIMHAVKDYDCNLLVVSDHGLRKTAKTININSFLERIGYLKFKGGVHNLKIARSSLDSRLKTTLLAGYRILRNIKKTPHPSSPAAIHKIIDWKKTKAFALMEICHGFMGIWLNTKENFTNGTINSLQEKEFVKKDIINRLNDLKDSQWMKPVRRIMLKEDLYPGSSRYIPDIFIETEQNYSVSLRPQNEMITYNDKFIHDLYGVFIAYGKDIQNIKKHLEGLGITDIACTVLSMFDAPLPSDADGRVIKEIFKSDSEIFARQTKYKDSFPDDVRQDYPSAESKKQQDTIMERLEKLGYL